MSTLFTHGYALLVGVNENSVECWALPEVAKDVQALTEVFTHPERCAYPKDNLKVIMGKDATRQGILDGLDWLNERLKADKEATAIIYYTGHGQREGSYTAPEFYFVPYDMREGQIKTRGLRASDFAESVSALKPKRLLAIFDCCYAGGMGVKGVDEYVSAALAPAWLMGGEKSMAEPGAKGVEMLAQGSGRAVLSSSTGEQRSYLRKDKSMSIFTYHLIESLTGHAQPQEGATEVLVSDVMSHVWRRVPGSAKNDWGERAKQDPDYQLNGNFPIALLLGGQGISKGQPAPDPLAAPPPRSEAVIINNSGSGAVAYGRGAVAAGQGGIAIGGNVSGSVINTGNQNTINQ